MVANVRDSRVYAAAIALLNARYDYSLASVIAADSSLPAWKEVWDEAEAVVSALFLEELFRDLEDARESERVARKVLSEVEYTNNILRKNLQDYEDNLDKKVARQVESELEQVYQNHEAQIDAIERDLEDCQDELRNIKTGLALQDEIRRVGPVRTIDHLILEDTYCIRDYNDETYMMEGQFRTWL